MIIKYLIIKQDTIVKRVINYRQTSNRVNQQSEIIKKKTLFVVENFVKSRQEQSCDDRIDSIHDADGSINYLSTIKFIISQYYAKL